MGKRALRGPGKFALPPPAKRASAAAAEDRLADEDEVARIDALFNEGGLGDDFFSDEDDFEDDFGDELDEFGGASLLDSWDFSPRLLRRGHPHLLQIQRGARRWAPKSLGLRQRLAFPDFLDPMQFEDPFEPGFVPTPGAASSSAPAPALAQARQLPGRRLPVDAAQDAAGEASSARKAKAPAQELAPEAVPGGRRPLFSRPRPAPEILRSDPAAWAPESAPQAEASAPAASAAAPPPLQDERRVNLPQLVGAEADTSGSPTHTPAQVPVIKEEIDDDFLDDVDADLEEPPEDQERDCKQRVKQEKECGDAADPKGTKCKAPRSATKGRHKKPALPQFAFEFFRKKCNDEASAGGSAAGEKDTPLLAELVSQWKALSEEEMQHYVHLADADRQRFEREYEEWRKHRQEAGKEEESLQDLLEKRRGTLERSLARVDKTCMKTSLRRPSRKPPSVPPNFPKQAVRTAYALFCKERKGQIEIKRPEEKQQEDTDEGSSAKGAGKGKGRGLAVLAELKKAWRELPTEEVRDFSVRAAQDQERFRKELEEWQSDPANEGMLEESVLQEAMRLAGKPRGRPAAAKVPRPRARDADVLRGPGRPDLGLDSMWGTLTELQTRALQGKKERAAEARQKSLAASAYAEASGAMGPIQDQGADKAVDDLLGDLLMVDQDTAPEASFEGVPGLDFPQDTGQFPVLEEAENAPRTLGPQLCLDESGNIVLNQSSLSRNLSQAENPIREEGGGVQEAVSQYTSAYKRTPACKWTVQETHMFYEALSLYGTDLFLVQTFFRNKSAGQIKTKYSKELKKNPELVEEALTTRSKKLTKDTFEKLHGKIDTSRHYKPPPTPEPGETPEPDGRVPEEEEDMDDLGGMPPPEPEYSAEDESLTTNRLMALFD